MLLNSRSLVMVEFYIWEFVNVAHQIEKDGFSNGILLKQVFFIKTFLMNMLIYSFLLLGNIVKKHLEKS